MHEGKEGSERIRKKKVFGNMGVGSSVFLPTKIGETLVQSDAKLSLFPRRTSDPQGDFLDFSKTQLGGTFTFSAVCRAQKSFLFLIFNSMRCSSYAAVDINDIFLDF